MDRLTNLLLVCAWFLAPIAIQAQSLPHQATSRLARDLSASFRKAANRAMPAIVTIETMSRGSGTEAGQVRGQFGDGTGLIVHRDGWILTNRHVVAGADAIRLRLADGREYWTEEVREDEWSDLAILSIHAKSLPVATFGNSDRVQLGDRVVAAGNSFGLGISINPGTISAARRRMLDTNIVLMQTNAVSNPGASGGPLLNIDGQVIGICEGAYSEHGGFDGVSFAIPGNVVKFVVDELIHHARVRWPYVGISYETLSPSVAQRIGMRSAPFGAIVTRVFPHTPAQQAGIRVADVITSFAGQPVSDGMELGERILSAKLETPVELILLRAGEKLVCQVTPQLRPAAGALPIFREQAPAKSDTAHFQDRVLGLAVSNAKGSPLDSKGVQVEDVVPGRAAFYAGIRRGMAISHVGRTAVHNIEEFKQAVKNDADVNGVLLLVWASQHGRFMVVKEPPILRRGSKPDSGRRSATAERPIGDFAR